MRDLDLMAQYLLKLRQEKLQLAHTQTLIADPNPHQQLMYIKASAHEAELCSRILGALKVLVGDSGKFIKEFLNDHQ